MALRQETINPTGVRAMVLVEPAIDPGKQTERFDLIYHMARHRPSRRLLRNRRINNITHYAQEAGRKLHLPSLETLGSIRADGSDILYHDLLMPMRDDTYNATVRMSLDARSLERLDGVLNRNRWNKKHVPPFLVIAGKQDKRAHADEVLHFYEMATGMGYRASQTVVDTDHDFAGADHDIFERVAKESMDFFDGALGAPEPRFRTVSRVLRGISRGMKILRDYRQRHKA